MIVPRNPLNRGAEPESLNALLADRATRLPEYGFEYRGEADDSMRQLSFADLARRAAAIAAGLRERTQPGDRAVLAYPAGTEFVAALFGCFAAGVIAVPVAVPRVGRRDAGFLNVATDCTPTLILSDAETTTRSAGIGTVPWLDTTPFTQGESATFAATPSTLAVLQYTSGSVGTPRGVKLTHANLLANTRAVAAAMRLNEFSRILNWLPHFHDMGLIGNILCGVRVGACVRLLSPAAVVRDPLSWFCQATEFRASITGGPCSMLRHALRRFIPEAGVGLDLSKLETLYVGAEPVSARVMTEFAATFAPFGLKPDALFPCYGLAEATLIVSGGPHGAVRTIGHAGRTHVSCGRTVEGTTIRVVDPETGSERPDGMEGELTVRGPGVADGYWNGAAIGPELFTGDLGFRTDGGWFISGRKKDLIILRGQNHFPQDLEDAIAGCGDDLAGAAAALIALEDADDDVELVLVQEVPRRTTPEDCRRFTHRAATALGERFGLPLSRVAFVPKGTIPKTTSGKTRRGECRRLFLADELQPLRTLTVIESVTSTAAAETDSDLDTMLTAALARRLSLDPAGIDRDAPLAAFGLDSLSVIAWAAELELQLGRPVPPTLLYGASSIRRLAVELGNNGGDRPATPAVAVAEPIAVVGLSCRFPGAGTPEAFVELLRQGRVVSGKRPADRGSGDDLPDAAYLTKDPFAFDPEFFGIAPREAPYLDPHHRLLLEETWTALERAGIVPSSLRGRAVGTFVGAAAGEYAEMLLKAGAVGEHAATGAAGAMAANRIAYHFDLQGPSLVVDTACSSGLAALHTACRSLRAGDCELAIVGAANLLLTTERTRALAKGGMLSPGGRCRTFAADADGYGRGEGCAVVILEPLAAARLAGRRVLAVLEAVGMNQDGRSNGIAAPNGFAQSALIRRTLAEAGRAPADVTCLEAHGTGTRLGDSIEITAAVEALNHGGGTCVVGSAKANIGHLEAASGLAGFLKVVLQIRHGFLAPHPLDGPLNPLLPIARTRLIVSMAEQAWPRPRIAGVSSFGFGGTNVHAVVSDAGTEHAVTPLRPGLPILPMSAPTRDGLRAVLARWDARLQSASDQEMPELRYAAGCGREHFAVRLAATGRTANECRRSLSRGLSAPKPGKAAVPKIAFLFSGQGGLTPGIGRELAEHCEAYRAAWADCAATAQRLFGVDLAVLRDDPNLAENPHASHIVQFAAGWSIAAMWTAFGIHPQAVLGHSLGEYAAVAFAGGLSLEQALTLVEARGRAMAACPAGRMFACRGQEAELRELLTNRGDISAVNGPNDFVAACAEATADDLQRDVMNAGFEVVPLTVPRAYHTAAVEAGLPMLHAAARGLTAQPLRLPFQSTLTGTRLNTSPDADYWVNQMRRPVLFHAALLRLIADGFNTFLEVGPPSGLASLGTRSFPDATFLPTLQRGRPEADAAAAAVARLYEAGHALHWPAIVPPTGEPAFDRMPTYPFQRRRFGFFPTTPTPASHNGNTDSVLEQFRATLHDSPEIDVPNLDAFRAEVERRSGAYAAAALADLSKRGLPVAPASRRLHSFLRSIAATEEAPSLDRGWAEKYPNFAVEATLFDRCGESLADVLGGVRNGTDVLFAGDGPSLLEALYARSAVALHTNAVLAGFLQRRANAATPERPLRILELGAGTGGTTRGLLNVLPAESFEYTFTDLSAAFVTPARESWGTTPGMTFRTLDIERPVAAQGFAEGNYDVVIAANVLHACTDLRVAVQNARSLLVPNGVLALIEGTGPQRLLDIIFGITAGWWRFAADPLRPSHPLASPDVWKRLLQESHFLTAACDRDFRERHSEQMVLVAQADDRTFFGKPNGKSTGAAFMLPPVAAFSPASLIGLPVPERTAALLTFLTAELARLLATEPHRLDADTALTAFGLDSLLAIQWHNRIVGIVGPVATAVDILKGLTLRDLARRCVEHGSPARPASAAVPVAFAAMTAAEVDDLSETELDDLVGSLWPVSVVVGENRG